MKNLLVFGILIVMNNIHSQETRHFNLTQNYNKVITYEVQGLSESDLIIANALFFNGRLNEEQKNLTKNPYDYPKGDKWNPLNQYVQKISNSGEYQNCRTSDVNYQRPVIIGEKIIDVNLSEKGPWGVGYSSNDEVTYHLKINIENEKISLSIDEGKYFRTLYVNGSEIERRKNFDQMFNKKGKIKKVLNNDAKVIVKAINNSISTYFNFIECFKNKKEKIDSEYSVRFNKQLKEDTLAQLKAFANNWVLIESNLKWIEKDYSTTVQWFNKNIFNGGQDIYTPSCYSYIMDAMDYYWGYPGSIEEDEFKSKWKSIFDLNYSSFGHAFQNGNCGWASFKLENVEYLGHLNEGDWYKLTILGGCGENDYSQTLLRVVKIIEENGSFRIANFISLRDE